jgi:Ca2+-binding EF-hand superfamily protein
VASAVGRTADDPQVTAARLAHEAVWQDMDADADDRVTFEQYRDWAGPETFERTCRSVLGSMFDLADADADGRLERSEFRRLRTAMGNAQDGVDEAFDNLDSDADGLVGRDDYLEAIRGFVVTGIAAMAPAYGADQTAHEVQPSH